MPDLKMLISARWPGNPIRCPVCNSHHSLAPNYGALHWYCSPCKQSFSPITGTWMHNYKRPLTKLLEAISLFAAGNSAYAASKATDVVPATMYALYKRLRAAISAAGLTTSTLSTEMALRAALAVQPEWREHRRNVSRKRDLSQQPHSNC